MRDAGELWQCTHITRIFTLQKVTYIYKHVRIDLCKIINIEFHFLYTAFLILCLYVCLFPPIFAFFFFLAEHLYFLLYFPNEIGQSLPCLVWETVIDWIDWWVFLASCSSIQWKDHRFVCFVCIFSCLEECYICRKIYLISLIYSSSDHLL